MAADLEIKPAGSLQIIVNIPVNGETLHKKYTHYIGDDEAESIAKDGYGEVLDFMKRQINRDIDKIKG